MLDAEESPDSPPILQLVFLTDQTVIGWNHEAELEALLADNRSWSENNAALLLFVILNISFTGKSEQ